jgi:hypothetical protein
MRLANLSGKELLLHGLAIGISALYVKEIGRKRGYAAN